MNHLWSGCILDSPTWKTCNPWEILETWDEVIALSGRRWTQWTLRQHRQGWLGSFKTGCRRQMSLLVSWMFHMVMSSHPRNSLMLVKWDSHSWKWTQNREKSPGSWVICKAQNRINQAASVFLSAPPWCWPTLNMRYEPWQLIFMGLHPNDFPRHRQMAQTWMGSKFGNSEYPWQSK